MHSPMHDALYAQPVRDRQAGRERAARESRLAPPPADGRRARSAVMLFVVVVIGLGLARLASVEGFAGGVLTAAATLAPLIAALVAVHRSPRSGIRGWLRRALAWRQHPSRYLLAAGAPLTAGAAITAGVLLVDRPNAAVDPGLLAVLAAVLVVGFPLALAEELGWRGWLQHHLQQRWGALLAALAVGAVWASWHAPLHAIAGTVHADLHPGVYATFLMAVSVLLAALYNATAGSVPVVATAHIGVNLALGVPIIALPDVASSLLLSATVAAAVLASLLMIGTRGRLCQTTTRRPPPVRTARPTTSGCGSVPLLPPPTPSS